MAAVAQDATGTYLLYQAADGRRLAKRTAAGALVQVQWLSRCREAPQHNACSGADRDVVAEGSRWWAVWSEYVGDAEATLELFEAKTIGADLGRRQVTRVGEHDTGASLVLRPDGGAVMVWSITDFGGHRTELGYGTADAGGRWRLGTFPTPRFTQHFEGHNNAQVLLDDGVTFVGWDHNASGDRPDPLWQRVYVADGHDGRFARHTFRHQGAGVRLAATQGRVLAAWTTRNAPRRACVALRPRTGACGLAASCRAPAATTSSSR